MPPPIQSPTLPAAPSQGESGGDKKELVAKLKAIEQSLAALPEEEWCQSHRLALQAQAGELKKQISNTKSIGARIDGCKGALERALRRQQQAQDAIQEATTKRDSAAQDVVRFQAELRELRELEVDRSIQQQEGGCINRMQSEMAQVLSEMSSSTFVAQEEISAATSRMRELFNGILEIKSRAEGRAHVIQSSPSIGGSHVYQLLQAQSQVPKQAHVPATQLPAPLPSQVLPPTAVQSPTPEELKIAVETPVVMDTSEATSQAAGFHVDASRNGGA